MNIRKYSTEGMALNADFVALIWILGLKHAQYTKIRALLFLKNFESTMKVALIFGF